MNKDYLLKDSKVFCMFPWLHLNVTPKGDIYPCCNHDYKNPIGNSKTTSLKETFNNDKMKELRRNMLNGVPTKDCEFCYKHESTGPYSFRTYSLEQFSNRFDEIVPFTNEDGSVDDFKMRYFDVRFSNICNFKCRTCSAEFSSQWAAENNKSRKIPKPILFHADDNKGHLLEEVLGHIHNIDLAYFAGGEPLITEEHYIILEEMIRQGRTDITLRYNTNASSIKYKHHDILSLWKHFKKIELSCSVDHYGERAEWLRHGTDWGQIETNLLAFRNLDYVSFQMNTVFSIFNYSTIGDFYEYLRNKNILRADDWHHTLYQAINPSYYCAKSLPKELKTLARENALSFIGKQGFKAIDSALQDAVKFAEESDTWEKNTAEFLSNTLSIDKLRGEDFAKTFPELQSLVDIL
jgi:radical SAM protein with 4Fe4S-binding SPASM domain